MCEKSRYLDRKKAAARNAAQRIVTNNKLGVKNDDRMIPDEKEIVR